MLVPGAIPHESQLAIGAQDIEKVLLDKKIISVITKSSAKSVCLPMNMIFIQTEEQPCTIPTFKVEL